MEKIKALTSKDGKSEWPYKDKNMIAVKYSDCGKCLLNETGCCSYLFASEYPDCSLDFIKEIIYIEKPAE